MTNEKIKKQLVDSGVKDLKEFGYSTVTTQTILTDKVYKKFFKSMLNDNKGQSQQIDEVIDQLLVVLNKEPSLPLVAIKVIILEWLPIIDFNWTTAGEYYVYFDDAYCAELYFDGNTFFNKSDDMPFLNVHEMQAFCEVPQDLIPDNMPFRKRFGEQTTKQ